MNKITLIVLGLIAVACFAYGMSADYQDNNNPVMVNIAGHN